MRIYNARKSQISVPLTVTEKIVVPSFGISESFLPNPRFLSLIVTSFDYSDIALIVSGPNEMTMCSETPCAAGFVVNSLEEALERFSVETGASMKCAAKVIDPINEERLEAEKKAEKEELEKAIEEEITEEEEAPTTAPEETEDQSSLGEPEAPEENVTEEEEAPAPKKKGGRKHKK